MAFDTLTRATVMEVVEEIIFQYTTNNGLLNNSNNNGNPMILAASDNTISLDGLFFLIRRQPNTMLSMVRHRDNNRATNRHRNDSGVDGTASDANNDTEDGRHNANNNNYTGDTSNNDQGSNTNHNTVTVLRSTRKRKRN